LQFYRHCCNYHHINQLLKYIGSEGKEEWVNCRRGRVESPYRRYLRKKNLQFPRGETSTSTVKIVLLDTILRSENKPSLKPWIRAVSAGIQVDASSIEHDELSVLYQTAAGDALPASTRPNGRDSSHALWGYSSRWSSSWAAIFGVIRAGPPGRLD